MTGTPRNERIGGWFGGKPKLSGCSRRSGRRSGLWLEDQQPEDAVALREVADLGSLSRGRCPR